MHDGGTVVVIQGPASAPGPSPRWFRQMGWHVVNMTNYPEAVLAKEAGLPYGAVALVTDYDAGVDGQEPVTMEAVFARMAENVARVRDLHRPGRPPPSLTHPRATLPLTSPEVLDPREARHGGPSIPFVACRRRCASSGSSSPGDPSSTGS